jgi:carbonic anhydrase
MAAFRMAENELPAQSSSPGRLFLPEHLIAGYEAFLDGRFRHEQEKYRDLAEVGQKPRVMIIGCCDSRVSPEVIFDVAPGEIFTVRNVAALVPPYNPDHDLHGTSAALEFGVMGLRVEHLIVMAHARCGGVKTYAQGDADPYQRPLSSGDFIGKWMSLIEPAAAHLRTPREPMTDYVEALAKASVIQSIANLRTFPWIATLEARGMLKLHGAYFDIMNALLLALDESTHQFVAVAPKAHAAAIEEPRF